MSDTTRTDLLETLGFQTGDSVFVEDTPGWYSDFSNSNGLDLEPGLPATHAHIFCDTKATLADFLDTNDIDEITDSLWLSWPKKGSGIKTDLTEKNIRDMLLPLGWKDTKTADIDELWSGLQFTRRDT